MQQNIIIGFLCECFKITSGSLQENIRYLSEVVILRGNLLRVAHFVERKVIPIELVSIDKFL